MNPSQKKSPSLSIVIPTRNGKNFLRGLLTQLRKQILYSQSPIWVVDSASTDGTPECAREFGARVISISPEEFNHGDSRNLGIRESGGKYICLFTQDALPVGDRYLATLVQSIEEQEAAGGFARQIPRPEASPLVRRDVERWLAGSSERRVSAISSPNAFFSLSPMERYRLCVFDNVASIVRREVWERIPFPRTPFGEDIEWAFRVLCNGYSLIYEPEAAVQHSHERSPDYTYNRTLIDHYRLYSLFGLRTVPSSWKAVRGALTTILKDSIFLLRNPQCNRRWLHSLVECPYHAWASAWGQYRGAQAAACGLPPPLSRDV